MRRWGPYVSVAQRRANAEKAARKLLEAGEELRPVQCAGRSMAKTFWGKAWCANLESYSDFANRLPRGRTYARNGSVLNLRVTTAAGKAATIDALVSGSELYRITIHTKALPTARWRAIQQDCTGQIDTVVELLGGRVSSGVMAVVTRRGEGLFPAPAELTMHCTCPDWATMCKHVAAVLYGVGARLDDDPALLFALRGVDPNDMVAEALAELTPRPARGRVLGADQVASLFGLALEEDDDAEVADWRPPGESNAAVQPAQPAQPAQPRRPPQPALTRAWQPARRRLAKRARAAAMMSLSATERRVLSLIYNESGLQAAVMATRLGLTEATAVAAADVLTRAGLVDLSG